MTEASSPTNVPPSSRAKLLRRAVLLLLPAIAMAIIWQVTPLRSLIEPDAVVEALGAARDAWWSPFLVVGVSVVGCFLMVPLTLVVLAHGAIYPFPMNFIVAEVSMLLAAVAMFLVGRWAGEDVVARLVPRELKAQLDEMGTKGVFGLAALRWIPVAHFGLLNVSLGALGLPLSRFFVGTLIGQTVMVVIWVGLGDRIRAILNDPNLATVGLLAGVVVTLVVCVVGMRYWVQRGRAGSS